MSAVAIIFLAVALGADPVPDLNSPQSPPKPHPLAPSLKATTEAEEQRFDQVVDRFILYDTGQLKGPEAKKALEDFLKLPPEAAFALIRGLNKSAEIDHSCPALVIARRLAKQFQASSDRELLQYARESVGSGVTKTRHGAVLKDLKLTCSARQAALDRQTPPKITMKP